MVGSGTGHRHHRRERAGDLVRPTHDRAPCDLAAPGAAELICVARTLVLAKLKRGERALAAFDADEVQHAEHLARPPGAHAVGEGRAGRGDDERYDHIGMGPDEGHDAGPRLPRAGPGWKRAR